MYENLLLIEIYEKIENFYGEYTISIQHVRKWYRKFKSSCENIVAESYAGRPIFVADKKLENKVGAIILRDQIAKLSNIVCQVSVAYDTFRISLQKN